MGRVSVLLLDKVRDNKTTTKTAKGEKQMRKLALIILLALAVATNASYIVKWYDTTTPQGYLSGAASYGIGFDSEAINWINPPFVITHLEMNLLQPNTTGYFYCKIFDGTTARSGDITIPMSQLHDGINYVDIPDVTITSITTELRLMFSATSGGSYYVRKDSSRNPSAHYYTYNGSTFTPTAETQGDWIMGINVCPNATSVSPASLGKVKASFK